MPELLSNARRVTGIVMPIGNGSVGKTSIANTLRGILLDEIQTTKTKNMEFEYIQDQLSIPNQNYLITQQFLIPPGQKQNEGDNSSRSFETVIKIYDFMLHQVDVILLSYDITILDSFQSLEFWIGQTIKLCHSHTNLILVGTHLDQQEYREVTIPMIETAREFIISQLSRNKPEWKGECTWIDISNLNGQNSQTLHRTISYGILLAQEIIEPGTINFHTPQLIKLPV